MSFIQLTELKFKSLLSEFGNRAERYENGIKTIRYTLVRMTDNNFNLSYHLKFTKANIQINFWFEKNSYLNSKEYVNVSIFNRNETFEDDKLKNILKTSDFLLFKETVNNLFLQYR
jgi:hypothetical protein